MIILLLIFSSFFVTSFANDGNFFYILYLLFLGVFINNTYCEQHCQKVCLERIIRYENIYKMTWICSRLTLSDIMV